tara:strand:+ start:3653 stop:3934 length:282 start_codon:yes stop_codon:yes gene_type:complete
MFALEQELACQSRVHRSFLTSVCDHEAVSIASCEDAVFRLEVFLDLKLFVQNECMHDTIFIPGSHDQRGSFYTENLHGYLSFDLQAIEGQYFL